MFESLPWRTYERIVAAIEAEKRGLDFSVTPNARIRGLISRRIRQIDVLVDLRWSDDVSSRTIIDAKLRRRKVNIKDVESLIGMMQDCRASRGIIVCETGYTASALRRAQDAVTIRLLEANEIAEFQWASYEACLGSCSIKESVSRRGLVLWDAQHAFTIGTGFLIVFSGKCDSCHEFHIWCWECGLRFAIPDEDHTRCRCTGRIWASLVEQDPEDQLNAAYLLLCDEGMDLSRGPVALDRRALR